MLKIFDTMLLRTCIADTRSNILYITEALLVDLYWLLENHCDLSITAIADHVADARRRAARSLPG